MGYKFDILKNNLLGIGTASIGLAGAGVGAAFSSVSNEPTSIAASSMIGGVAGASVIPAVGVAGALGYKAFSNMDKVGSAAIGIGKEVAGFAKGTVDMLNESNPWKNPIGKIVNTAKNTSRKLVDYKPNTRIWNPTKKIMESKGGLKLTGLGWGAIGVAGIAEGAWKAKETFEASRMGQMDPYITTATPRIPSYQDNAGASGDLVFALNANRRG